MNTYIFKIRLYVCINLLKKNLKSHLIIDPVCFNGKLFDPFEDPQMQTGFILNYIKSPKRSKESEMYHIAIPDAEAYYTSQR